MIFPDRVTCPILWLGRMRYRADKYKNLFAGHVRFHVAELLVGLNNNFLFSLIKVKAFTGYMATWNKNYISQAPLQLNIAIGL